MRNSFLRKAYFSEFKKKKKKKTENIKKIFDTKKDQKKTPRINFCQKFFLNFFKNMKKTDLFLQICFVYSQVFALLNIIDFTVTMKGLEDQLLNMVVVSEQSVSGWMGGWVDGWMDGWMGGLVGWVDGWMGGLVGWVDGWFGWMGGWVNGWFSWMGGWVV